MSETKKTLTRSPGRNSKDQKTRVVYFNANSTTVMPRSVIDSMLKWVNRGNPADDHKAAQEGRRLISMFRDLIASVCGFSLEGGDGFAVVLTSGASESNNFIVTSVQRSYTHKTGKIPHIITSAVEHKSLMDCCLGLEREKLIELTILPVQTADKTMTCLGAVNPATVKAAIRSNTCLITIMAANNETGIINDINAIGDIARDAKIPFHTDAVQLFGKTPINTKETHVDAFSLSFHKLHGPPGIGALVIRRNFIAGYELCPLICGSQNEGLRGGTESLHSIAAAFAAIDYTLSDRAEKNEKVLKMRNSIIAVLAKRIPCMYLEDYVKSSKDSAELSKYVQSGTPLVVWIAPKGAPQGAPQGPSQGPSQGPMPSAQVLPGTLFLSVLKAKFCNRAARAALEARGIIVSVGSACNSSSHAPSGVVQAMKIPRELQDGVLRVSLPDNVSVEDIIHFVKNFIHVVMSGEALSNF